MRTLGIKKQITTGLKFVGKKVGFDPEYVFRGGFWLMVGHTLHIVSNLVLTVALGNLLEKNAFGTYQFILGLGAVLSSFTLSGIGIAIKRTVARGGEGALRTGFKQQLRWSIGIVLVSGAVASYYYINGNNLLGTAFLIVGAATPFMEGFSLYRSYLLGKGLFKETTLLGMWRKPLPVIAILTTLYFSDDTLMIVFVYYLSNTVSLAWLYFLTVRKYHLISDEYEELVPYAKSISVINIIRSLANNADRIVIFQSLGAAPVATFMLALLPLTQLQKSLGMVGHLVFPRFAQKNLGQIMQGFTRKIIVFLAVSSATAVAYVVCAPFLYKLLFPAYTEAILMSQVLAVILIFKPTTLINQLFESQKMIRAQQVSVITSMLVQIVSLYVLVNLFGVWGAVYATILTNAYWMIISVTLLLYYKK